MYNSSEDLLEKQIWIRNKNQDEKLVLLRHISQEDITKVEQRLNALKDIDHPSIAVPQLKQYENGEYYLEENCHEISVRQYFTQLDTTSRLQLASRMCHLVESLFMLLPEDHQYHGNIRLECFSLNHENQLMLGGLGIQEDKIPDMERLDRLIIRLFDKQEHPDNTINSFLNGLRDPQPAYNRPLQLRDAIRRLLVGKNISTNPPQKPLASGMFLKKALENIEERPDPVPSVDEDFELSSVDFQTLKTAQADELESINFDDDFDLTDVPDLGSIQDMEDLELDSMNIDELSAVPSKGSLDLEDFDINDEADLLEVPSLEKSNFEDLASPGIDDDLDDFDINIPSQEESLGENWNPDIPVTPPPTAESSFETDPFLHEKLTSHTGLSVEEPSEAVSEYDNFEEEEEDQIDDGQRKKWIRAAMLMGSLGAIAFGWSMLENNDKEKAKEQNDNDNVEVQAEKVDKSVSKEEGTADKTTSDGKKAATPEKGTQETKNAKTVEKAEKKTIKNKKGKKSTAQESTASIKKPSAEKPTFVPAKKKPVKNSVLETKSTSKKEKTQASTSNSYGKTATKTQSKSDMEKELQTITEPVESTTELDGTQESLEEATAPLVIPVDDTEYVFDWDITSNEAITGKINPKSKVHLMGISNENPEDFIRANILLLMQAQQTGKTKDIDFILRKVFRKKEHQDNPIFLMADAHNKLNKQKFQKSLDSLSILDTHFDAIPKQLRDAYMIERAEIRALAHLALFYKTPEDTQRFEKTIKSFESLQKVAEDQNITDIAQRAQAEITNLQNWRPVS